MKLRNRILDHEHSMTYLVIGYAGVGYKYFVWWVQPCLKSLHRVWDLCSALGLVDKPIGVLTVFVTVVDIVPKIQGTILALQ